MKKGTKPASQEIRIFLKCYWINYLHPFQLELEVLNRHLSGGPSHLPYRSITAHCLASLSVSFPFLAGLPSTINLFIPACLVWISHALYATIWWLVINRRSAFIQTHTHRQRLQTAEEVDFIHPYSPYGDSIILVIDSWRCFNRRRGHGDKFSGCFICICASKCSWGLLAA